MENMELWNKVCTTDPKFTKAVSFGKYKFTDIDAHWNLRRATELWGPFGGKWGFTDIRINYILGADGATIGLYVWGLFFYPDGKFDIAADMPYDPKGETLKKLQTMCIGKALSRLGFSADVYMGRFDDSAYIKEMEDKYAGTTSDSSSGPNTDTAVPAQGTVKASGNTTKRKAKYPEPDPVASGILGALSQKYMDKVAHDEQYKGYVVSFTNVCHAVYDAFGKYPTKIESIPTLMDKVTLEQVLEKNDFLDGIE